MSRDYGSPRFMSYNKLIILYTKRRERRNGRAHARHASGGTTQVAEVVRGYEWVGERVGTVYITVRRGAGGAAGGAAGDAASDGAGSAASAGKARSRSLFPLQIQIPQAASLCDSGGGAPQGLLRRVTPTPPATGREAAQWQTGQAPREVVALAPTAATGRLRAAFSGWRE